PPPYARHLLSSHSSSFSRRQSPSFPTRRSSDLPVTVKTRLYRARRRLHKTLKGAFVSALDDAFPFLGKRCSNITNSVMDRLARRSEEHTLNSSHVSISYAVFCLKKKNTKTNRG